MRNYRMDNIRCFLIFCVVFGHMLELVPGVEPLYRIIYSFHMPAFIFISGYFANVDKAKILTKLVYPYVLFQVLYQVFDALVLQKDPDSLGVQFTTPYWLLWYLLALIFYYLLLPFIKTSNRCAAFAAACVLSIAVGFDQTIGYYLSLSRFFTFLPYFVLGVVLSQIDVEHWLESKVLLIGTASIAIVSCCILGSPGSLPITVRALYGSYSYAAAGSSAGTRILLLLIGINWIFFFLCYFPAQRIPILSSVGKYTLIPFLAHGFIRQYIANRGGVFIYTQYANLGLAFLISLSIILIFGNQYVGNALHLIFTGRGLELLWRKICRTGNTKTS